MLRATLSTRFPQWPLRRNFTVLALESSADDTCAAVVTSDRRVLSNVVMKQNDINEEWGGIHPYYAIQAHQRNMPVAVQRALALASISAPQLDGIAYTRGPGIGGCLSVCSNAAQTLAAALGKPLVGVHHMQAHALTPLLTSSSVSSPLHPTFPFLTLLISGGHTLLLLASSPSSFKIISTTADEAIGRVFDKVARALGVKWGEKGFGAGLEAFCGEPESLVGGLSQSEDAATDHIEHVPVAEDVPSMPLPMRLSPGFSFASLHSTVERYIFNNGGIDNLPLSVRRALARSFQRGAIGQLETKLVMALGMCAKEGVHVRHVVVSGGVASNLFLRARLKAAVETFVQDEPIALVFPPPELCTDNAAMIGWAAMPRFLSGATDEYGLALRAKWSIEDLDR